jgi:hypothetical protein
LLKDVSLEYKEASLSLKRGDSLSKIMKSGSIKNISLIQNMETTKKGGKKIAETY